MPKNIIKNNAINDNIYSFLLKEYEKAFDTVNQVHEGMKNVVQFYLIFSGAIVAALPKIFELINKNNMPNITVKMTIGLCSSLGMIAGIYATILLLKLRFRQAWSYSRINLIRSIYLSPLTEINSQIKCYCETKYGSIKEYSLNKKHLIFSDWFLLACVTLTIVAFFLVLFIYFYFELNLFWTIIFTLLLPIILINLKGVVG